MSPNVGGSVDTHSCSGLKFIVNDSKKYHQLGLQRVNNLTSDPRGALRRPWLSKM